jgi:hypothetical protein
MRQRLVRLWDTLTLGSVARRRERRDYPQGNDMVFAILLRQMVEREQARRGARASSRFTRHPSMRIA